MKEFAYSNLYIDDFQETFGSMFQYVERDLQIDPKVFYDMFMISDVAHGIEYGDPKYIAGMSGIELARAVILEKTCKYPDIENKFYPDRSEWYWVGFVLSYYQWLRNVSFMMIDSLGLTVDTIKDKYILHEADISKFVEVADSITQLDRGKGRVISYYRKLNGYSQREFAEYTGVPLRMIQLYEQGQNDISKANVDYVVRMANGLGIDVEMLC